MATMISLIVPVYQNSENIGPLIAALQQLKDNLEGDLEVVFVVDGSPDDSLLQLGAALPTAGLRAQLLSLSRNFGSFAAIRAGLEAARADFFAIMAADLQEPPELILEFYKRLQAGTCDVVVGQRVGRADPGASELLSRVFWRFYRRFIQPEIPPGGVDAFACTRMVRDQLLNLRENNSSLVGLLFWVGFRRELVPYERRARDFGKSAWSFPRKVRYLVDSIFSFSDLPIQVLLRVGVLGLLASVIFGAVVVLAKLFGNIPVPGYAAIVLAVMFFGALNCFGLGVIGGMCGAHSKIPSSARAILWQGVRSLRRSPGLEPSMSKETYYRHPKAFVESEHIGERTRVWAFAHVLPGAKVGAECNICDHTFIENDVIVGDRVTIKNGVQLWDGVRLEDDVFIGPNVTFTNDKTPRSLQHPDEYTPLIVRKGASIGANATLLPGITIGQHAMVGAGTVVTQSVPPFAVVVGNPARIVRYTDRVGSPARTPSRKILSESSVDTLRVRGVTVHRAPMVTDLRGNLSARELGNGLPFAPQRYFVVFDVPSKEVRGAHAHRKCGLLLVCLKGSVACMVDDGMERDEVLLSSPEIALHLAPMVWCVQYKYSSDAVLLVLASDAYDPDDYIRDYDQFLTERRAYGIKRTKG